MQRCSTTLIKMRMAVRSDDFVCLSDDDGLKYIDKLLKSQCTAKDMETLGIKDSDVRSLLLLNRVFRVGTDQAAEFFDIELQRNTLRGKLKGFYPYRSPPTQQKLETFFFGIF